jgi:hypothetical protein
MTLMIALITALSFAKTDPCNGSVDDYAATTELLKGYQEQVKDSQLNVGAKDMSEAVVKDVHKLMKDGRICTPEHEFWAIMNLLQSRKQAVADEAYEWSKTLLSQTEKEKRYANAPWLAGLAYDHWSIAYGRLQSYGSQTSVNSQNKLCLIWVDPRFTDEARAQYGHPSLEQAIERVLKANGVTDAKPTIRELKMRDMWCKPEAWDGTRSDLADPDTSR